MRFGAGLLGPAPRSPGAQPARPSVRRRERRWGGCPPSPPSSVLPLPQGEQQPPSLQLCPYLCSPGPRRVFTCRCGAERDPGASGRWRRRQTPSRCCRPRVRRAGRSRDLPREALRKPAAAAAPSATGREGPATPSPGNRTQLLDGPRRRLRPVSFRPEGGSAPAAQERWPARGVAVRRRGMRPALHRAGCGTAWPSRLRPGVPGRRQAGSMAGRRRAGRAGGRRGSIPLPWVNWHGLAPPLPPGA